MGSCSQWPKGTHLSGASWFGCRTFDYRLLISVIPWVAPQLTISDLHTSGLTWWLFLVSLVSIFFLLQSCPFPKMAALTKWINASLCDLLPAFLGSSQPVTEASGLPTGPLFCSFFLLINACVLSEWPFSNRVTEWLMCLVVFSFGTPPDLPRLELIGLCSLLQSDSPTTYPLHRILLTT